MSPVATVSLGLASALAISGICGLANGVMVVGLGVHPFIITLGTMWMLRGIAFVVSRAESILVPQPLTNVAKASLGLGTTLYPVPLLAMLAVTAVGSIYLTRTVMGRHVFAVGGNPEASRFSGLNLGRIHLGVFALSGLTAGFAAFLGAGFYGSATSSDAQRLRAVRDRVGCRRRGQPRRGKGKRRERDARRHADRHDPPGDSHAAPGSELRVDHHRQRPHHRGRPRPGRHTPLGAPPRPRGPVMAMLPAIRLAGITKQYPGVLALAGVSFDIERGSCHAICGENGAGKSTLGKILSGLERADAGEVSLDGRPVRFGSPREALKAGVAMVHQELAFCDNLTVAENLCLSHLPRRFTLVDRSALHDRANALLTDVGSTIEPGRRMDTLSVAEQQVVQIAGAVAAGHMSSCSTNRRVVLANPKPSICLR